MNINKNDDFTLFRETTVPTVLSISGILNAHTPELCIFENGAAHPITPGYSLCYSLSQKPYQYERYQCSPDYRGKKVDGKQQKATDNEKQDVTVLFPWLPLFGVKASDRVLDKRPLNNSASSTSMESLINTSY